MSILNSFDSPQNMNLNEESKVLGHGLRKRMDDRLKASLETEKLDEFGYPTCDIEDAIDAEFLPKLTDVSDSDDLTKELQDRKYYVIEFVYSLQSARKLGTKFVALKAVNVGIGKRMRLRWISWCSLSLMTMTNVASVQFTNLYDG
ncbi:hypothetical protein BDQ12DRAFT_668702 [Crucibulum laeve]|uniref:Uncharacterized protein n=1 Tax=Crucibulum laeve TaxID=68775 RepID=A0A5C3LS58_9AGAR|nr:hypothetical protein BDQ12DRAFT_668702 [Crucibulum laeve]